MTRDEKVWLAMTVAAAVNLVALMVAQAFRC